AGPGDPDPRAATAQQHERDAVRAEILGTDADRPAGEVASVYPADQVVLARPGSALMDDDLELEEWDPDAGGFDAPPSPAQKPFELRDPSEPALPSFSDDEPTIRLAGEDDVLDEFGLEDGDAEHRPPADYLVPRTEARRERNTQATDYRDEYDLAPETEPSLDALPKRKPGPRTVTAHRPCRTCGYDLKGLSTKGRCPECGTPVNASRDSEKLAFANSDWAGTIVKGLWLLVAGELLGYGIFSKYAIGDTPTIWTGLEFVSAALLLAGAWLATTPDPSGRGEATYGRSRKTIRVCSILAAATFAVAFSATLAFGPMSIFQRGALLLFIVGQVASFVALLAMLRYTRRLALRVPEPHLAERADFLFWAYGGITGALLLTLAVAIVATIAASQMGAAAILSASVWLMLGCVGAIGGLLYVIFSVMYLVMLGQLAAAINAQREWGDQLAEWDPA
ncbi:MAG: hypothetical protein AAGK78_00425, partial [Planctomycetota bacterium]